MRVNAVYCVPVLGYLLCSFVNVHMFYVWAHCNVKHSEVAPPRPIMMPDCSVLAWLCDDTRLTTTAAISICWLRLNILSAAPYPLLLSARQLKIPTSWRCLVTQGLKTDQSQMHILDNMEHFIFYLNITANYGLGISLVRANSCSIPGGMSVIL